MVANINADMSGGTNLIIPNQALADLFAWLLQESVGENAEQDALTEESEIRPSGMGKADGSDEKKQEPAASIAEGVLAPLVDPCLVNVPMLAQCDQRPADLPDTGDVIEKMKLPLLNPESNKNTERSCPKSSKEISTNGPIEASAGPELFTEAQPQDAPKMVEGDSTSSKPEFVDPAPSPIALNESEYEPQSIANVQPKLTKSSDSPAPLPMTEVGRGTRAVSETGKTVSPTPVKLAADKKMETKGKVIFAREPGVLVSTAAGRSAEAELPDLPRRTHSVNDTASATLPLSPTEARRLPSVAMNAERLAEHLAGPEMKFTVRLGDAGQVQVVTSLRDRTMEIGVASDRTETVMALRSEVPFLESRMRSQSVELGEVKVSFQGGGPMMDLGYSEQRRPGREWRSSIAPYVAADDGAEVSVPAEESMSRLSAGTTGLMSWIA